MASGVRSLRIFPSTRWEMKGSIIAIRRALGQVAHGPGARLQGGHRGRVLRVDPDQHLAAVEAARGETGFSQKMCLPARLAPDAEPGVCTGRGGDDHGVDRAVGQHAVVAPGPGHLEPLGHPAAAVGVGVEDTGELGRGTGRTGWRRGSAPCGPRPPARSGSVASCRWVTRAGLLRRGPELFRLLLQQGRHVGAAPPADSSSWLSASSSLPTGYSFDLTLTGW